MIKPIDGAGLESEVTRGDVVVFCWATWSTPSMMMAPLVEEVAAEVNHFEFFSLDARSNQTYLQKLQVKKLPELLIFSAGQLTGRITGFIGKKQLKERLSEQGPGLVRKVTHP